MATTIIALHAESKVIGDTNNVGSKVNTYSITIDGSIEEKSKKLAASEKWNVWESNVGGSLASFTMAFVESSEDFQVELTCDKAGGANKRQFVLQGRKNLPMMIPTNVSISGYSDNWGGGTQSQIDMIRVKNVGSTDANVRVVLVK